jgi:DNA-binding NarL/FixJ family response regulator
MTCTIDSMDSAPVRVMIVDDQPPFRNAARAVLERASAFELVAEAGSGEEAIDLVGEIQPDLILMDINMGGMTGIDATTVITNAHPEVTVVLVSTYQVEDLPPDVHESGAAAYLHKEDLSARALRKVWESGGEPGWRRRNGGAAAS